jgi:hypothetical protein
METRSVLTGFLSALILCGGVLVSGCTSNGKGTNNGSTKAAQRSYTNVEIRQRGHFTQNEEFAQAAAHNALDALTKAGVPEAALISAEVNRVRSGRGGTRPAYYDVWVNVAGCPSRVFFKAHAAGTIYEMNDEADCVAKAKATGTAN